MKQITLMQDSLSFGVALQKKSIPKSPPAILKSPNTLLRSSSKKSFNQLSNHLHHSKIRCIQRTNLTLRHLFSEYQYLPHNQYVLKLKQSSQDIPLNNRFDQWIQNIEKSTNNNSKYSIQRRSHEKISFINSFNKQREANKQRSQLKLMKIQTEATEQIQNESQNVDTQVEKYSFSQYFDRNNEQSMKDYQVKKSYNEQTEELLINSVNNDYQMPAQFKSRIQKKEEKRVRMNKEIIPRVNHFKGEYYDMIDKENQDINQQKVHKKEQIKGLQFSKNKRFKSSKKQRNELPSNKIE